MLISIEFLIILSYALEFQENCAIVLDVHLVGHVKVFPVVGGPWRAGAAAE